MLGSLTYEKEILHTITFFYLLLQGEGTWMPQE